MDNAQLKMKLKQLRRDLKGDYKEVADACGITVQSVSRILHGEWINHDVINKAIEVRDKLRSERLQKEIELSNRI